MAPALKTIIGSVAFATDATAYSANTSYPVVLQVLAPDGSAVPMGDYSVSTHTLDAATDAILAAQSARGALLKFGLVLNSTLSATVTGMDSSRTSGATFPVSKAFALQKASGTIKADLQAPTATLAQMADGDTILSGTAADNVDVTKVVVYRNGVEEVGEAVPANGAWSLAATVAASEKYTALAYDAAGNESAAVTVTAQ